MTVIYLGAGWFLGLWLASTIELTVPGWFVISIVGMAVSALFRHRTRDMPLFLCLTAAGLGGARYESAVARIDDSHVAYYNGRRDVTLKGLVVDEPDIRDKYVNLRVSVESISFPGQEMIPAEGTVLVRSARFPVIGYGTLLEAQGFLETPSEDGKFSYKDYLARQGIHSLMAFPGLTVISEEGGSPIRKAILQVKERARDSIRRSIPTPESALLIGILLGDDNGLSPELAEAFRATGLTHIIAISGFNIMIVIGVLVRLAEPLLGRRSAVILAIIGVGIYTVLVGADASVVRAAIMGSIYLITYRLMGRPNYAYASLILAGFLMTLVDPFAMWGVGFQLSFAATLGLMLYGEPFTEWTRASLTAVLGEGMTNQVIGLINDSVIITVAAQILTLPLTIAYFGQLSLVSLPANALVLPAQPGVMIWGGMATLGGLIAPAVGEALGYVAWLFLGYTTGLVNLFARLPGVTLLVHVSATTVLLTYSGIGALTWLTKQDEEYRKRIWEQLRRNFSRRLAVGAGLVVGMLVVAWGMTQPDGRLHVTFLDVGQGDAIFIETPSGRQILVDGGLYPTVLSDQMGRQMAFWDREIDIVVATHADADHVSGLSGVLERYRVGQLITDGEGVGVAASYDEVLVAAEEAAVEIHPASAGEEIVIDDGVRVQFLHPSQGWFSENRNENSVSLRLVYDEFTLLLTGDAEEAAERQMLTAGRPLSAVVFKAGHHGSRTSSNDFFLEAVRPQIIVVSVGKENHFGHPHAEVLERARDVGAAVLRTDELGTIEIISDGQQMWWRAHE